MKYIGKGTYWKVIFSIAFIIYIANLVSIIASKNVLFMTSSNGYNYLSVALTGVFMYLFYSSLKKGALTVRSVITIFILLVVIPFLLALMTGR